MAPSPLPPMRPQFMAQCPSLLPAFLVNVLRPPLFCAMQCNAHACTVLCGAGLRRTSPFSRPEWCCIDCSLWVVVHLLPPEWPGRRLVFQCFSNGHIHAALFTGLCLRFILLQELVFLTERRIQNSKPLRILENTQSRNTYTRARTYTHAFSQYTHTHLIFPNIHTHSPFAISSAVS